MEVDGRLSSAPRPLGMVRLDREARVTEANDEAARLLGFDSAADLITAAQSGSLLDPLRRAGARGEPVSFDVQLRRRDASITYHVIVVPEPGGARALLEEAAEPRVAERAGGYEFLESILNGLPNPVFVKDTQHRWVILNDDLCRFMGHSRAELLGKTDHDIFPAPQADVFWAKDDAVFRDGQLNQNEELITDAAGQLHVILTRKTVHTDAAGHRLLLGVITDITERKQIEEELRRSRDELDRRVAERTIALEEANRRLTADIAEREEAQRHLLEIEERKNEFLALLGHELRNPLTPIRTAVALMRRFGRPEPRLERAQEIIERQVLQMTRLIDDLLDVSRISRGKILLRKERLDLVDLVRAALGDRQSSLEAHGLTVETRLPAERLELVADPARLAQAIGNLLDNAEKFTDPGGTITVTVTLDAEGHGARVAVRDTGIGMSQELLGRLFAPFAQAERSLARGRGGLGLGLSLVKGLVELHGGTVTAASEGEGRGSELSLWLPLAPAGEDELRRPAAARPESAGGRRILVIEDNRDAAETLELALSLAGHQVAVAATGEEGLALAHEFRPRVVLSDIGLPGEIDGYAVARALRNDRALASAHLIAITGYGQEEDRRRAFDAGFDWHLTKPFDIDALERLIAGLPRGEDQPAAALP